jgi:hypothetical protein
MGIGSEELRAVTIETPMASDCLGGQRVGEWSRYFEEGKLRRWLCRYMI